MAFTRDKQTSGGGGFKRDKNPSTGGIGGGFERTNERSFWDNAGDYLRESSQNTLDAMGRPLETLDAAGRGLANFVTLGGADRFSAAMDKYYMGDERPYSEVYDETQKTSAEKDAAAGSWDDAVNVGAAIYNPYSAAQKYAPAPAATTLGKVANVGKRAAVSSTEQAGLSGAQSVIQGDSPEDIVRSMAAGGAFGAGGSIGADALGSVANVFRRKGGAPMYKTGEELVAAGDTAKRNTAGGKKLARDATLMKNILMAETKGPEGFAGLDRDIQRVGAKQLKIPFETERDISKLANPKLSAAKRGIANTLEFGGGWGKLAASKVFGGAPLVVGAALRAAADLGGDLDKKTLMKVKSDLLRGHVSGVNPNMTPEMKEQLRGYLAKTMAGGPRTNQ